MKSTLKNYLAEAEVSLEEHAVITEVETPDVEGDVTEVTEAVTEAEITATDVEEVSEPDAEVTDESAVSTEDLDLSDGETKIDVIDESTHTIDQVTEVLAKSEIKAAEIERDTEVLVEAQTAMERYSDLLELAMEDGGLNAQSAAFMRVGLEHYERLFGLEQQITPSVEAFGGSQSQRQATAISLEGIKEQMQKGWEAIKRAFAILWRTLQDFVTNIINGSKLVEKKAKDLAVRAKHAEKMVASDTDLLLKSPGRLFADGKWVGDEDGTALLMSITDYAANVYPASVANIGDALADAIHSLRTPEDLNKAGSYEQLKSLVRDVETEVKKLKAEFPHDAGKLKDGDERFANGVAVLQSVALPGNQALFLEYFDQTAGKDDTPQLGRIRLSVQEDRSAKGAPDTYTVSVGTAKALGDQAISIAKVAQRMTDLTKARANSKTMIDKLNKAVDHLRSLSDKSEEGWGKAVSALTGDVGQLQYSLGVRYTGILTYVVRALGAQLAVVEQQLGKYHEAKAE